MTWTQQKPRSLIVGVVDSVPKAASIVDRLLAAKLQPAALSLLSSDQTAERHLRAPIPPKSTPGATPGVGLARLAINLSTLTPLGAPASGLVATGMLRVE